MLVLFNENNLILKKCSNILINLLILLFHSFLPNSCQVSPFSMALSPSCLYHQYPSLSVCAKQSEITERLKVKTLKLLHLFVGDLPNTDIPAERKEVPPIQRVSLSSGVSIAFHTVAYN